MLLVTLFFFCIFCFCFLTCSYSELLRFWNRLANIMSLLTRLDRTSWTIFWPWTVDVISSWSFTLVSNTKCSFSIPSFL